MHGLYRFLKSTLLGGLLFLVPLAVLAALIGWGVDIALLSLIHI